MVAITGKKCLGVFMLLLLSYAAVYVLLFRLQFGPYIPAEYWLRDVQIVKRHICRSSGSPKTVILGGSNALFGFDSPKLAHYLGQPVVNFGLHAGLPLDYLLYRNDCSLQAGDTVILPLEYELYERDQADTSWFTTQIIAWDKAYFDRLNLLEKSRFLLSVSPLRLFSNLPQKFILRKERALSDEEAILHSMAAIWRTHRFEKGYRFENVNDRGDMERRESIHVELTPDYPVFQKDFSISEDAESILSRFMTSCRQNRIRVVVTWPCIIEDARRNLSQDIIFRNNIRKIKAFLSRHGVTVAGDPTDFAMKPHLFYDTKYHLNQTGRQLRTLKLAELMLREEHRRKQADTGMALMEIQKEVAFIQNRSRTIDRIRHLYRDSKKPAEAIRLLESDPAGGYLNETTAGILLDHLSRHWDPKLHSRAVSLLTAEKADIEGYYVGKNAYLMGTTPDGWTTGGGPGYILLKASPQTHPPRNIRLVCNAAVQTFPLSVTLQTESSEYMRTFDHPGEITIEFPEALHGEDRLFIVKTDKVWIPGGQDQRELGVQIRIE